MADAVIRSGGKQYRVAEGDTIRVEKLSGKPGDTVEFGDVLALGGETPKIGAPLLKEAKVSAEIVQQGRGDKVVIFKLKRRKKYRRKGGHRQAYTAVKITSIKS